ncbi:DoxX-like family protein [Dactylosporangium sp. NPDC051541]|uniref:DoxX-like family protein n=1 Tax=Dactylosporangium sp. NPDC051541 TaxID=3363977 RepID=UPI00378967BC
MSAVTGLARGAVASVWLYEGLWCKLVRPDAGQLAIVSGVPGAGSWSDGLLVLIGLAETALAGWVIWGRAGRAAAAVQTVLLVAFNAGGLLFGAGHIDEPGRMLTANAALLAAAWLLPERARRA